jgi:hypothetical protein
MQLVIVYTMLYACAGCRAGAAAKKVTVTTLLNGSYSQNNEQPYPADGITPSQRGITVPDIYIVTKN